ncbi:MAG: bacillithiol biosynthesis cysteine-adding enzyme BshC [Acidobacteria bacterium]|nr:bacillithiol biosynthesis cysteine-adding enzyme BshC [Acidobacteriota bacterium]
MPADATTPQTAAHLAVDIREFPWIRRLASDYAFAYDEVAPFFAGDPSTSTAWADTIARSRATERNPAALAQLLGAQQARRGAPAESRAAAARLADPATRVVITGQQAGLFGGPLFTLLKALTAMKLATEVERDHDVPVVPVFWIDAEDHDWPEVSGCTVLDATLAPHTVRLEDLPGAGERPIARLVLTDAIHAALDDLASTLPQTEFTPDLIDSLRRAYVPGRGMAEAFGVWLETVLGPHGLVVYDASDPASKPLAQRVFIDEIAAPGATAALAARAGQHLTERGYHAQVTPGDGAISLFHLDGSREGIKASGNEVTIGERHTTLTELAAEATTHPEQFSPNVLLRPLVQDAIFPTICYVAGPNELAYLGQLRGIYERFGIAMPLMYQRTTATLVDSATLRFLHKHALPLTALRPQDERVLNDLLESQLPPTVDTALTTAATIIGEQMEALARVVPQIDPTLAGTVNTTQGKLQHEMQTLHNKVIQAAKRKDDTLRRQFQHAQALTFPAGHPQEREIGFIWFLNRYGPALVPRLTEELPLGMGQHYVLSI